MVLRGKKNTQSTFREKNLFTDHKNLAIFEQESSNQKLKFPKSNPKITGDFIQLPVSISWGNDTINFVNDSKNLEFPVSQRQIEKILSVGQKGFQN